MLDISLNHTPGLPTVIELGYPGIEVVGWFGWLAPARTPQEIITRLNSDIVKVLRSPQTQERLIALGCERVGNAPREFAALVSAERGKWANVIKRSGIKLD
jgi:tripartite-type tricarboxylate transporter receptor subunit TctC